MKRCGAAPADLGLIDLSPVEMMAWLYCPIKLPLQPRNLPPNLEQFHPIVDAVAGDVGWERWGDSYVYLTAKTLWVTPEAPGNREGWHCDGYGSSDLNYIWSTCNGTEFFEPGFMFKYSDDHKESMLEMELDAEVMPQHIKTYPDKHLLRLDEAVIHRVAPCRKAGFRTFVKVSVSDHKYLLAGNSVNHELAPDWKYEPRGVERNDPLAPLMKAGDRNYDQGSTATDA